MRNAEILTKLTHVSIKRNCAVWLKDNLSALNYNSTKEEYFDIFLTTIIDPTNAIQEINDKIRLFYKDKIFKYVLTLAEFRYEYYKKIEEFLDYYNY